jgi:protein-ribulosamine 3-kinase
MKLDTAVVEILGLDPDQSNVSSHGGGGCSSAQTAKIISLLPDGSTKEFFMKTGHGSTARTMFEGEHASLSAIHSIVPTLCPQSYGWGTYRDKPSTAFLVTDFLTLSSRSSSSRSSGQSLAQKLAKLHTTPAPIPKDYSTPQFGFPVTTCCGDTPQDNTYTSSWSDFYANHRLRFILAQAEKSNGQDGELHRMVESVAKHVVPRLLADEHLNRGKGITPVVVHGDLWSGNASRGIIGSTKDPKTGKDKDPEDVIYDPSACYAHSEFELGIMKMFGGFDGNFLKEYHGLVPKSEPIDEYDDRVALYELYHHLNHYALFGGGYRGGAVRIMRDLVRKYVHDEGG